MRRGSDPTKRQQWSERLKRFARSGQTVAEFCRAESVSAPSFYEWKRKLISGSGESKRSPIRGGFKTVEVTTGSRQAATIRLPSGIVIDLGNDPATIQQIVGLVVDQSGAA